MRTVKVIHIGGSNQEYTLKEETRTVQDLFDMIGENFVQNNVNRRHITVYPTDTVRDGDKFVVGEPVKGNLDGEPFEVKLMIVGGKNFDLTVSNGDSIKDLIERLDASDAAKFFKPDGSSAFEIRDLKRGETIKIEDRVPRPLGSDSMIKILFSQKTKGNE